jgi:fucose permease
VGFLVYWLSGNFALALAGLFVTGLGVASLYPLILSLAIETAPELSALATTRASLASGLAILALPLTLGRVADAVGIRSAYAVMLVVLVALFGIVLTARKK